MDVPVAMADAIHSMFRVDAVEPGVRRRGGADRTCDRRAVPPGRHRLSQSAKPDSLFLSRLLLFDDFAANPAAALGGQFGPAEFARSSARWNGIDQSKCRLRPPLIREFLQREHEQVRFWTSRFSGARPDMLKEREKERMGCSRQARKAGARAVPVRQRQVFKNSPEKTA